VGTEKTYADSVFARPGRLAEDDGDDYKAQIHRMDADGTKSSLAKMMYDILRNPKRQFRYKEHKQKVKERRYHLRLEGSRVRKKEGALWYWITLLFHWRSHPWTKNCITSFFLQLFWL
jgi:hypothetical protein